MGKQQLTITIPECLNMEGLELRGNYRIIGYHQELLHVLEHKHAAAFVLTALLRWTKRKRDELLQKIMRLAENKQPPMQEEEMAIWIHMSFEGFADEFDGLFSHNTIKDAVGYLIKHEIIFQRKNINPRFKDYEYRVNLPKVRDLIQALPTHPVLRQRDNRKRDQKRSTKIGDSNNEPPKQAVSPKLANVPPKLVDVSPELAVESPILANHYTKSTQSLTKSNTEEDSERTQTTAPVIAPPPDAAIKTMFEALAKEHFGPDYTVIMPKAGSDVYGIMTELAERKPLLDEMRRVYLSLYNKQDSSGEYWCRDPNRLTFCAFLRGYNKQLEALNKPTRTNTPKSSSPGLHRASNGFCTPEYVRKLATMTPEQRRAEAKAKKEARLAQQQQEQHNV